MNHKGTVTLETQRLILRRFVPDDAPALFRNMSTVVGNSLEEVEIYFRDKWLDFYDSLETYQWLVVLKSLGEPIGTLKAFSVDTKRRSLEIGYGIGEKWWHQGIMTEAVHRSISFFFEEIGINRLSARHNATNPHSSGVMRNCGMRLEGILRQASQTGCDVHCYAILSEDYFSKEVKEAAAPNCHVIKSCTELMFHNLKISMDTADWNADICGAPAWRYIYHTIHSADKWFINPNKRFHEAEPFFHVSKLDWPDTPSDVIVSREIMYAYYEEVRIKILNYVGGLDETALCEVPDGCKNTRLGLILSQFRHMYAHIGILNGITISNTNHYPLVLNESTWRSGNLSYELYDNEVR